MPRPPGFYQLYWQGPGRVAQVTVLAAAAGAGLVAAASLPLDRPGIGWLITGLAAAAATSVVARRTGPETVPAGLATRVQRGAWGTAAVALLGVGTIRSAGWLFVLCVLTACVAGSLAVSGSGRRALGLLRGAFAVPFAAFRALPWAVRGAAALRRESGRPPWRMAATVALSVGLLIVFGSLFVSADAAFARLVDVGLPEVGGGTVVRWIFVFTVLALGTIGAAYLVSAPPHLDGAPVRPPRRVHRLEWVLPLAVLNVLFGAFVLLQLTVWFGGARHVVETAGLTYAEYARSGFWQLLVVTVLTLAVLGAAARWAPRESDVDRLLVRGLLGALAGLTLVIVASALYRMHVYEQAYGFTRLRVLVSLCELWLGLVFVMVLAAGVRLRATWLPRAVLGSAILALLALAGLNPDRFIADRNVDRYHAVGRVDVDYLAGLSADAVPALERLPYPLRDCALRTIVRDLADDPDDWRGFSIARERARRTPQIDTGPHCWRLTRD